MFDVASLSDVPAFRCGHAQNASGGTGCTVIVAPEGATCGVDVRGGGPATRETDLLRPENMIEAVHAVVLAGGSAFGLAASTGVMDELASRGIGFPVGTAHVPIVVGACLFDLLVGQNVFPDGAMGREATKAALDGNPRTPLAEGNVGAGTGASVGKLLGGEHAMKSGFGIHGLRMGSLTAVAIVAVNALGCVRGENGSWIAGCLGDDGLVMDPLASFSLMAAQASEGTDPALSESGTQAKAGPCANTTIGVVLTNAALTKAQATKVSSTVHDAYARAIKPVHTSNDGDTVFTFSSGEVAASADAVAVLATEAMQVAIERAALKATAAYGLPAALDIAAAR